MDNVYTNDLDSGKAARKLLGRYMAEYSMASSLHCLPSCDGLWLFLFRATYDFFFFFFFFCSLVFWSSAPTHDDYPCQA